MKEVPSRNHLNQLNVFRPGFVANDLLVPESSAKELQLFSLNSANLESRISEAISDKTILSSHHKWEQKSPFSFTFVSLGKSRNR